MAWGTKKKMFYNSDYITTSKHLISSVFNGRYCGTLLTLCVIAEGKSQEELEAEEEEEEEEAKNIQKRLAANLSEEDYDLSCFQVFTNDPPYNLQKSWSRTG